MKTFNILKADSNKNSSMAVTEVIATVEGRTRREAFKKYCEGLGSGYLTNFNELTARRTGKNKRRRVEVISIKEAVISNSQKEAVKGLDFLGVQVIKTRDGRFNRLQEGFKILSFMDRETKRSVGLKVRENEVTEALKVLGVKQ